MVAWCVFEILVLNICDLFLLYEKMDMVVPTGTRVVLFHLVFCIIVMLNKKFKPVSIHQNTVSIAEETLSRTVELICD